MPVSIRDILLYKQQGRLITALTAWDALWADMLDQAGVDLILVGDSLAMVALGHHTTLPLTLEEMIHHAKAVRRSVKNALLVCDLPFMSYQESPQQALRAAGRCLKEAEVEAVKVEGGYATMVATVATLVDAGIPVLGHVGLTPQSVHIQGLRQQGQSPENQDRLHQEALALEQAGAFGLVLEHIPDTLAQSISQSLSIPTIGIGAGAHCDGQILVTADVLGLGQRLPPFAKAYADLRSLSSQALAQFCQEVRNGQFPAPRSSPP
ncbi:3-methyl-2-oxobutanoate hydroxymethyltransferase [Prochlorothrix hollandica]|uniref:3-methyl-2-oxobutanoate hydroxymethyltransferase n=1 Tax=Prochlorothrix hollandica TaxID=1223 RepID=UPI0003479963|nr:3-methyl-2-oxobutanoate hydroxymethyltransferase [Prochlorothrix hollandica]